MCGAYVKIISPVSEFRDRVKLGVKECYKCTESQHNGYQTLNPNTCKITSESQPKRYNTLQKYPIQIIFTRISPICNIKGYDIYSKYLKFFTRAYVQSFYCTQNDSFTNGCSVRTPRVKPYIIKITEEKYCITRKYFSL